MTPQELAVLPAYTRVRYNMSPDEGYDHGTITRAGTICYILWDPLTYGDSGWTNIIDTKSKAWAAYIGDISLDTPSETA